MNYALRKKEESCIYLKTPHFPTHSKSQFLVTVRLFSSSFFSSDETTRYLLEKEKHLVPAYVWIQFYGITPLHLMFHLNWNSFFFVISLFFGVLRRPNTMCEIEYSIAIFLLTTAIIFSETLDNVHIDWNCCVDEIQVHPNVT